MLKVWSFFKSLAIINTLDNFNNNVTSMMRLGFAGIYVKISH